MSDVVEVSELTKVYGDLKALDHVSFAIEADKIYGLLGRNGAGKTTLMRIMTAQELGASGAVRLFGETPYENSRALRQTCFVKDNQVYPNNYRLRDTLDQAALFFPNWNHAYALSLCEDFHLPLNRRMRKLSRGMLSSAGAIIGLASRAPLTIFDEPYLGMDAVARSLFYDRLLADYADVPRTIILSTHLIDEVSRLLEHILVLDQGRLILDEEAEALRGRAFAVVGPTAKVDAYTADKETLYRERLGGMESASVMSDARLEDRQQAEALGLEVTPISLQRLIVYLTSQRIERKAVGAR